MKFLLIFFSSLISNFQDVPPVRNKLYTPSADGCGSLGLKIDKDYLPAIEMEKCCNDHDICYDTCNKDKELCDLGKIECASFS